MTIFTFIIAAIALVIGVRFAFFAFFWVIGFGLGFVMRFAKALVVRPYRAIVGVTMLVKDFVQWLVQHVIPTEIRILLKRN